jgi:hypothetical protein
MSGNSAGGGAERDIMILPQVVIEIWWWSVYPKVLLPYKFSKLRPIKYRILAISHQK